MFVIATILQLKLAIHIGQTNGILRSVKIQAVLRLIHMSVITSNASLIPEYVLPYLVFIKCISGLPYNLSYRLKGLTQINDLTIKTMCCK